MSGGWQLGARGRSRKFVLILPLLLLPLPLALSPPADARTVKLAHEGANVTLAFVSQIAALAHAGWLSPEGLEHLIRAAKSSGRIGNPYAQAGTSSELLQRNALDVFLSDARFDHARALRELTRFARQLGTKRKQRNVGVERSKLVPMTFVPIGTGRQAFELQSTPLTVGQLAKLRRQRPPGALFQADLPRVDLSLEQMLSIVRQLNQRGDGYTYQLPTQAQWLTALRKVEGGYQRIFEEALVDERALLRHAWVANNSNAQLQPVGLLEPFYVSGKPIHDLFGNTLEPLLDGEKAGLVGFDVTRLAKLVLIQYEHHRDEYPLIAPYQGDKRPSIGLRLCRVKTGQPKTGRQAGRTQ